MSASFYKFRPGGYAKKLYSVRFWNFDVRVGLQLLVTSEYLQPSRAPPTRRDIRQTYVATFFFGLRQAEASIASSLSLLAMTVRVRSPDGALGSRLRRAQG